MYKELINQLRNTQSRSKRDLLDRAANTIEELQARLETTTKAMEYHRGREWHLYQKYEAPRPMTKDEAATLLEQVVVWDDPEMAMAHRMAVDALLLLAMEDGEYGPA